MTVPQPLAVKFLRYIDVGPANVQGGAWGLWLRVLYEFWGFCVNGMNDLKHPGGFPTGSSPTTHLTGVINMPANWESGSTVLLYSNSDGITNDGMPYFTGSNFTSAMVGKWLTVWKSGSTCTDDSIYLITGLYPAGAATSSVIGVDNNMGCTPYSSSLKLAFTERSNINYRVVDFNSSAVVTTYTVQNFIIIRMDGAPYVNSGQLVPQVRLRGGTFRNDNAPRGIAVLMSPSGSWNGSQFNEGLTGGNTGSAFVGGAVNVGEIGPHSGNSFDWSNSGSANGSTNGGTVTMNIIAAQDFFIQQSRGGHASYSSMVHTEIPQRVYPEQYDPNPICTMGGTGIYTSFSDGYGYAFGFYMYATDNKPYKHWLAVKHQAGDFYNPDAASSLQGYTNGIYSNMWFNPFTNKFFFTDAILGTNQPAPGHYLARARLRRARFIGPIVSSMQRLGDNGEWLHTLNGVLWPWDNALIPYTIFKQGS